MTLAPVPGGRVFTGHRRVQLGDASPGGRLRLDALARHAQDVSNDDTRDGRLGDDGWVVRRTSVEVRRFPVVGEELELRTFCSGTGRRWAERRVAVAGAGGGAIDVVSLWVHLDMATGRPALLSARFHELYDAAAAGRTVTARLHHADPPAGPTVAARRPWPIRFVDFDVMGHMNNAAYWCAVEEELARRRDLRAPLRAEVEFRTGIDPGDDVTPRGAGRGGRAAPLVAARRRRAGVIGHVWRRLVSAVPVTPDDVEAASRRVDGHVRRTPVLTMERGAFGLGGGCVLKLELLQHTGSFKAARRVQPGAWRRSVPAAGLVAASGGNHGVAVAHVARALGHRAEVFVPATSPAAKVDRIRGLGADVRVGGAIYDDAQAAATGARRRDRRVARPPVRPCAGGGRSGHHGSRARRAGSRRSTRCSSPSAAAGSSPACASWFGDRVQIVSVEPETIPAMYEARRAGRPVEVGVSGLAADSLGAKAIGAVPFACAAPFVDDAVLVTDDAIRDAQRELWASVRLMAEPGGAAALAAVLSGAYRPAPDERVVVVVCGSNVDPATVVTP